MKTTHQVGCLDSSVGWHVLASSGRHNMTEMLKVGKWPQNSEAFIRSGTGIERAGASPNGNDETVRQNGRYG